MGVDYIDESEVLTPADEEYHNIAAPSPILRAASPKLRQPHTNGTVN
jgi:hypothetical protein